jgi:hypothetical protein
MLEFANKISNFLNDSGPAKIMVQKVQLDVYRRKKQIVVNIPTRFATNLFVLKSIWESKQALNSNLQQAVAAEAWRAPGAPGANSEGNGYKVRNIFERKYPGAEYFWENVELLIELLQPFSDAIHQLEADRPLLAQCHVVVEALHQNVAAFALKHQEKRNGSIVLLLEGTFERRYAVEKGSARAPI